ncbi:nitronate monooxygenase [Paraburkholderia sp. RL17-383-BIF-A]|uniref:NAD(P)H-dependent flavin oxidoreductase n=1 Tax=Paraburkholderia sp. RL17-383-BIF-A TaxID=3031631 RepID=UPI0038BBB697
MWNATAISQRLNIEYPIIQGPFGGGGSSVDLVAAVSNAGGLGSFGLQSVEADEIGTIVGHIRKVTERPFSVNLWVSTPGSIPELDDVMAVKVRDILAPHFEYLGLEVPALAERLIPDSDQQMEAMLDACPPVVSFVYGVPPEWVVEQCRLRGITMMGTATTIEEAMALESANVDCIIASSFEAGGHRGSFSTSAEDSLSGAMSLIPQVVDNVKLPVVAAGGIADARGIAAAFALGAQGVQIGTAFLACNESNASDLHRAALFSAHAKNTKLSRAITGRLARNIQSDFIDEIHVSGLNIPPYPVEAWFIKQLQAATLEQKRYEYLSFSAGQTASLIRHKKASELMADLIRDTPRLLGRILRGSVAA